MSTFIITSTRENPWTLPQFETVQETLKSAFKFIKNLQKLQECPYEVSLLLTDDVTIKGINNEWRKLDKPTNVLSFPLGQLHQAIEGQPFILLGDVIMAYGVIEKEAKEQNKSFDNHTKHLAVHGLLHLFGFDHGTHEQACEMEGLEVLILKEMGVNDPYRLLVG